MNGSRLREGASSEILLAFWKDELGRQTPWLAILGTWIALTTAMDLLIGPVDYPTTFSILMSIFVFVWVGFTVLPDVASRPQAFLRTRPLPRETLWNVRTSLLVGLPMAAILALTWVLCRLSPTGWPDGAAWVATSALWIGGIWIIALIAAISHSWFRYIFFSILALFTPVIPLLYYLVLELGVRASPSLMALLILISLVGLIKLQERASGWRWQPMRVLFCLWAILALGCLVMPNPNRITVKKAAPTEALIGLEPIYDPRIGPQAGSWICGSTKPGQSFEALGLVDLSSVSLVDERGRVLLDQGLEKLSYSNEFHYSQQEFPAWTFESDFCMDPEQTTERLLARDRQREGLRWRVEGRTSEYRRTAILRFPLPESSSWSWAERSGWSSRGRLGRVETRGSLLKAELGIPYLLDTGEPLSSDSLIVRWVGPEGSWQRSGLVTPIQARHPSSLGLTFLRHWSEMSFELTFVAHNGDAASLLEGSAIEIYQMQMGERPFVAEASVGDLSDWMLEAKGRQGNKR